MKSEAFHLKEAESRLDLQGNKLDEKVVYDYCYNYIAIFLKLFEENSPVETFFEGIKDLGDEEMNHNQLLYFKLHIMPYLIDGAPEEILPSLKAMDSAIQAAETQTNLWYEFDEHRNYKSNEVTAKTERPRFLETIEYSIDVCDATISFEDVEKYVFYYFTTAFIESDSES
jgi:hypothetical protein